MRAYSELCSLKSAICKHDDTHQGWTGASQAVCRVEAGHRTLTRSAQLCKEHWCVVGLPQEVVHTAVGPVVVSGKDLQHVCTEQSQQ